MISMTQKLINNKHAYVSDDGSVYFDIKSFKNTAISRISIWKAWKLVHESITMNTTKTMYPILLSGNDMMLVMVRIFGKHDLRPKMDQRRSKADQAGI